MPSTSAAESSLGSSTYSSGQGYPSETTGTSARDTLPAEQSKHHYGRDAALAGGAGAAGAGAYELGKGHNDTGPASKTIGPHDSNLANVMDPRVRPDADKLLKSGQSNVANEPAKEHHYGRDATVAGGAGAAGLGAYEATKHHNENTAPLAQDQASTGHHGHHEHNKLHKEDKHEKELEKAREKEAAKASDHGEKKEGFLHKILHPGHKDKDADHGMNAHEKSLHDKHEHERAQEGVLANEPVHGLNQHELDTHEKNEKARILEGGVVYTPEHAKYDQEMAKHQQQGHGGTLHSGQSELGSSNTSSLPTGATGSASHNTSSVPSDGIVTEPHTGLPMNVGKYGTGQGGIDGAQQIPGLHEPIAEGSGAETDWNKIKKGNTLY